MGGAQFHLYYDYGAICFYSNNLKLKTIANLHHNHRITLFPLIYPNDIFSTCHGEVVRR